MPDTAKSVAAKPAAIRLRGVRVHNLKGFDLDIPLGKFVVISGVSGSGKSSLAFDTLYAEGQRRYIESFPVYARQFLPKFDKPAVDRLENIPPAIAVAQNAGGGGPQTTVAAASGILDYLRLVFARMSKTTCTRCGNLVKRETPESVLESLQAMPAGTQVTVAFPLVPEETEDAAELTQSLRERGYVRVDLVDRIVRLADEALPSPLPSTPIRVILDRLTVGRSPESRFSEALEAAFDAGSGVVHTQMESDWRAWSDRFLCDHCGEEFPEPAPALFHWSNPQAACPACEGTGSETLKGKRGKGAGAAIARPCPQCGGKRFIPQVLAHKVAGRDFAETVAQSIEDASTFFAPLASERHAARPAIEQIRRRLSFLNNVGLGYLTLDRRIRTLSIGEARRVALTAVFGTGLARALFVLDEPTAGLHPLDTARLIDAIADLQGSGNTVVVVEHDPAVILAADHVIDLGPGAGSEGGSIVYQGPPDGLFEAEDSYTADYLEPTDFVEREYRKPRGLLRLEGARHLNLKHLDVSFPLGCLCVVAGVSGSGKSSLVLETLYPAVARALGDKSSVPGEFDRLSGFERLDDVVLVDGAASSRSSRSNPATVLKVFDDIRRMFAETLEAKTRGLEPGDFSFNLPGGRCERCEGSGILTVDMQFLPEVHMTCPDCNGARYQRRVLEVKMRGLNIAEVLDLTIKRAFGFFRNELKIQARLRQLIEVGLDYVRLGQPASSLSGGESQRLKLASYLAGPKSRRCLFLFEEPTTGLHPADVETVLECFGSLLAVGHSIIVVEHNADVLRAADHLIELGPGAGPQGGTIVAHGTPAELARLETPTARVLRGEMVFRDEKLT